MLKTIAILEGNPDVSVAQMLIGVTLIELHMPYIQKHARSLVKK